MHDKIIKYKRFEFGWIVDYLNPTDVLTKLNRCDSLRFPIG